MVDSLVLGNLWTEKFLLKKLCAHNKMIIFGLIDEFNGHNRLPHQKGLVKDFKDVQSKSCTSRYDAIVRIRTFKH